MSSASGNNESNGAHTAPEAHDQNNALAGIAEALKQPTWKPRERLISTITGLAAISAAVAAVVAAIYAVFSVLTVQESATAQLQQAQFDSAIKAITSREPAVRVAGVTLLRHSVEDRMDKANDDEKRSAAYNSYLTAEEALASFLRAPSTIAVLPTGSSPAIPNLTQPIQGVTPIRPEHAGPTIDHQYAASQLLFLLGTNDQKRLAKVVDDPDVSIDLSYTELSGITWNDIDFSWLDSKYLYGLDLRDAKLARSKWDHAELTESLFQCADLSSDHPGSQTPGASFQGATLRSAHFEHANLSGADFRGADLQGAHFTGAYIDGAQFAGAHGAILTDAIGTSKDGIRGIQKPNDYDIGVCAANDWDRWTS